MLERDELEGITQYEKDRNGHGREYKVLSSFQAEEVKVI